MSAVKVEKMNTLIQREISLILQNDVRDKNLSLCTITSVKTTNDLSISTIYVSFLGKDYDQRKGMESLDKSKGFIRSLLAKRIKMRKVPQLIFKVDTSLEYGNHIESIIRELNKDK